MIDSQNHTPSILQREDRLFVNDDCVAAARQHLDDESVDLIVTDPPYGIGGDRLHQHYNRDESFVVEGYVDVPADQYAGFSSAWIREAERVLRPGGSLYVISGYSHLREILNALYETSLHEVNHIIWRYNFGVWTSRKFVSSHYHVLYYVKPGSEPTFNLEARYGRDEKDREGNLNYRDREDVWSIAREYKPGTVKNKNELPSDLLQKIIQYSSHPDDLIADFFLGGGSTARAALGLDRRIVGFELSPRVFDEKIADLMDVQRGGLLTSLRKPVITEVANRGEQWGVDDEDDLLAKFKHLLARGLTKRAAIDILQEQLGRGYFAIAKALKRAATRLDPASDDQMSLF